MKFPDSIRSAPVRFLVAGLLAVGASTALADADKGPARVQVTWAPAEQLTEVKDNPINRGWIRTSDWEKMLADHLRARADRVLPEGQQLHVAIDDIKLAGSFEPWRRPGMDDARIMKDIYPPRMRLHYRLLSNDGATIREGEAKLTDGAFLQRSPASSTDPLRFDKRLIDDWLRKEFAPARS